MEKQSFNTITMWKTMTHFFAKFMFLGFCVLCFGNCTHEQNPLEMAEKAESPNMNFLFASNASLAGRLYMTFSGKEFKPCINTVSAFFNKYHTCSNCEDFEKNPKKWNFVQVKEPKAGDIAIQHHAKTGRAYHAVIIVKIENGKYYVSHAVRTKYIKNVELKNKENLTFYRYISD